jgi:hypothetical protein
VYAETHYIGEEKGATMGWLGLPDLWIFRKEVKGCGARVEEKRYDIIHIIAE